MEKEVNSSAQDTTNYQTLFYSRIDQLGLKHIYVKSPTGHSDQYNGDFIELLNIAGTGIKLKVLDQLKKEGGSVNLEKLVAETDGFVLVTKAQGWYDEKVEAAWQDYKRGYIQDIIKQEETKSVQEKNNRHKSRGKSLALGLAKIGLYGLVTAAAAAAGIAAIYKYYIKPDLQDEIKNSVPYIPTLEDNINAATERFPVLRMFENQLPEQKKENPPEEPPKKDNTEEEF